MRGAKGILTHAMRSSMARRSYSLLVAFLLAAVSFAVSANATPIPLDGPGPAHATSFPRDFLAGGLSQRPPHRGLHAFDDSTIPNRFIVALTDGVDADVAAAEIAERHGIALGHVFRNALHGFAFEIPSPVLEAVREDPRVRFVQPDLVVRPLAQTLPTGVDRIEADRNATARIDGIDERIDAAIAIIDSGVDLDHPDLNVAGSMSFVRSEPSPDDLNGHGTHTAGTAAAIDDGIGVVGVAPGARVFALKVLDRTGFGSLSDVIAAVDWVTANAATIDVASMSLGTFIPNADDGNCGLTNRDALHLAICNSVRAGVTYVVSAGNEKVDAKDISPAAYDEVITVSALSDLDGTPLDDRITWFSNFGADVDLIAPGRDILSTWPGGTYETLSGTSMAAPHVSGAAALYIASVRGQTRTRPLPAQVASYLKGQGEPAPLSGWPGDSDGIPEPLLRVRDMPAGSADGGTSLVVVRPSSIEADGESRATAFALPRDAGGNILGPGHAVAFAATAGTLLGSPEHGGTDLYFQDVRSPSGGAGTRAQVVAAADSVPLSRTADLVFTEDLLIDGNLPLVPDPGGQFDAAVASNGRDFLVAWWTQSEATFSVQAARFSGDGTRLDAAPLALETAIRSKQQLAAPPPIPRVVSDGRDYLVVWPGPGDPFDVHAAIVRSSDGSVVSGFALATPSDQYGPSVGFDGANYLVAWYDFNSRSARFDLLAAFVRPDGTVVNSRGLIVVGSASPAVWIGEAPAVAFDGANYVVAWSRIAVGPCAFDPSRACALDSDVRAVRLSPGGGVLDPGGFPLPHASGYQRFPSAAAGLVGALLAWESLLVDGATGFITSEHIDAVRIRQDGAVLDSVPIRIAGPDPAAFLPAVASDGEDTFLVAWTNGGHPDDWNVLGNRVRGSSGEVQDPLGLSISIGPADQVRPAVASGGPIFLAVFTDFGSFARTGEDLVGQRIRSAPPPTIDVRFGAPWTQLYAGQSMDVTVLAAVGGSPLPDASVVASAVGGSLVPSTGATDAEGIFRMTFSPDFVTANTVANIDLTVSKDPFLPVSARLSVDVWVSPPELRLELTSSCHEVMSFETVKVRAKVTVDGAGVTGALITASSFAGGTFSPVAELGGGLYEFTWDAPMVVTQTFVRIDIRAKVGGYLDAIGRLVILVDPNQTNPASPRQIFLLAEASAVVVSVGGTVTVTLYAFTIEGFVISGAVGAATLRGPGSLTPIVEVGCGVYRFTYTAPESVTGPTAVLITVGINKFGYAVATMRVGITVVP